MAGVVALRSGVVVAILLIALAFALKDVLSGPSDPAPPTRLRVPDDAPGTLLATSEGDLYRVGASAEPRVRLTRGRGVRSPEWSPDATRIAFSRDSHIWVLDTRTRRATPLTAGPGLDVDPTWSPDGERIAFQRALVGRRRSIWVMSADGTNQHRAGPGRSPDWAPEGSRLAFERANAVWVMNADGGRQRRVAAPGGDPEWSPDGSRLVFERRSAIWIVRADGTRARRLAKPGRDPDWSPDGRRIAFAASGMIWTVNADGTGLHPIVASAGLEQPAWSPRLPGPERRASGPRGG
jgi:Tol biopolymer transport system component